MKILISAMLAATAIAVPATAQAQQRPSILIVDTDRVASDCTACKAAGTQLQQRESQLRTRAQQLQQQLQTEGKPLQDAVTALKGKEPDAALQQRITAFQTKERGAQQELSNSQRTLQSTAANVNQQIGTKLLQVVEQVRARRGASVVMAKSGTIASDTSIDVTGEVLTALNQQLPSVSVTPLPQQQQQQQQPQGR
jgi:Skp family chaperone for outer membrane proteins